MTYYRDCEDTQCTCDPATRRCVVPVEPDRKAAVDVLSTYRRLVLMGAEDSFGVTLDAIVAALGIGGELDETT